MHPKSRHLTPLLFLLAFFCIRIQAQPQTLKFTTYTTNNGLLHNYTKKCVEDHKGFIWIASEIGLSRFDGVNFKNFQHDETDPSSLPQNTINDISVDNRDRIWLALDNGLCYYNPEEACFTSIDITGDYTKAPTVLALCTDTIHKAVWFMTDKGLYFISTTDFSIHSTSCKNPTPTKINAMYVSSDDRIWIACYRHGFIIYDIAHDRANQEVPETWAMNFYEDKEHTLWISCWHSYQLIAWNMATGAYRFWREKEKDGADKNVVMTSACQSAFLGDALLLVTTVQMGIRLFDIHRGEFVGGFTRDIFSTYSLPTDYINYSFTDSHDILWFCTWEGLCKVNFQEQQFRSLEIPFLLTPLFPYYNLVEGIVASDEPGVWWLGIDACGVFKYDTADKKYLIELLADIRKPNQFESASWTEFLLKTDDGLIWTVHATGIASIHNNVVTRYEPPAHTIRPGRKTVCVGPDRTLWITTVTHLVNFDLVTKKYTSYEIDTSQHGPIPTRSVAESGFCNDGNLWTGTLKGLYKFDMDCHTSQRIYFHSTEGDSISINTINSIVTDGQETVYMGTPVGIGIYNIHSGRYQLKGIQQQVYPTLSKSMLVDKAGNVWIYTTHALFKYDPRKDEFSKFTTADGIYGFSSDPTHLFSFRDNFYIGYRGAYTEFDPLKVNINKTPVKPLITELLIGNQLQKLDIDRYSNLTFSVPPGKKSISFHYTGIDYTNSDKITFRYKLNTEQEWHDAGTTRSVTYNNLPPGYYSFQLKALNSSGLMTEEEAVFNLYIIPTLIQRWWFWPLLALLFVCLVFFLASRRVKKIREEERRKTEANKMMAELETKLLRSQMNPHFIFNSLNSIQKYIWENKEEDAAEYLAQFAKLIRAILENSKKEFISLREELEVLKLYIDLEHRRSNGKFDYQIHLKDIPNPEEIAIPPLLLQPYVENAIWHGVNKKAGHGQIDILIQKKNHSIEFTVDDDGAGRNLEQRNSGSVTPGKTSIGSEISLQRVRQLQHETSDSGVQIIDKMNNGSPSGTTVIITIPKKYLAHA